jgi:predicted RNA binding protein YcfA (HicA-like mRNA interferase family)
VTQLAKLYARLLARRPLSFAELQRLVKAFGFELDRIKGSHHIYRRPDVPERVNIQPDGRAAKTYQVRLFADMVEAYGLTLDEDR